MKRLLPALLIMAAALTFSQRGAAQNADTSLLRVHVVVTGSNGQPVAGLTEGQFSAEIDGKPAPIRGFAAPDPAAPPEVDVILDAVNVPFTELAYANQQVQKFLERNGGKLGQTYSTYLLTDTGTRQIGNAGASGAELSRSLATDAGVLRELRRSAGLYGAVDRLDLCVAALNTMAEDAAKRPGRKIFLFISPGWPLLDVPDSVYSQNDKHTFASIVRLTDLLNSANVTVYMVAPQNGTGDFSDRRFVYKAYEKPVRQLGQAVYANLALQTFAVHTGGLVFDSSNDVVAGMDSSVADANAAYTLLLERPAAKSEKIEFRSVEVKSPAGKARTEFGYYDQRAR